MTEILIVLFVTITIGLLVILVYSMLKPKESTREGYAFKCLAAIVALTTLTITSISSRQGIGDQVMSLIAALLGHPTPEAAPAPLSEKALIFLLAVIVVYVIDKSHKGWKGAISTDEVDRQRMKRSISLVSQAISESGRIAKMKPKREIFEEEKRVDPVAIPEEPNLVWYDHARELFELWKPSSSFRGRGKPDWDPQEKCWMGEDRSRGTGLLLYCVKERPNSNDLMMFAKHSSSIANQGSAVYVVYRDLNGVPCKNTAIFEEDNIKVISEEYLYLNIVDFADYFSEIERRVESESFSGTDIKIRDIYTASSISSDDSGADVVSKNLGLYLSEWSKRPAGRQIAILGEYGQGKSTGALMYVYASIKSALSYSGGRVPILLELRGKSPANLSSQELLAAWAQQYKLHASALMKLLIAGRLILIFEGFDEMANIANLEARVSHFRSLWRLAYPRSKIVFTGRRNLFFEDRELQIVFKGANEGTAATMCEILHLCPFDSDKIRESLRWVGDTTCKEILDAAESSPQILDIVARPSLLYIVASLWDELRGSLVQGRITSAQVIDQFILHSYDRQQVKERELNFMTLTRTERQYFHEGLAVYMASRGATNQITNANLRAAMERLYRAYPEGVNISGSVVLETARPPLKVRMCDHDEAIEAVMTDARTHGILVNDLGQKDAFRFAHKSFYELLAAKAHAYELLNIEPIFYKSISEAMDGNIGFSDRAPEILNFFSEFLLTKIRATTGTSDIAIPVFDLLLGISKDRAPIRHSLRTIQLLVLRAMHSPRLVISYNLLAVASAGFFFFTRTNFTQTLKIDILNSVTGVSSALLAIFLFIQFFFGIYFLFSTSRLPRKARLWAAVLLANDISMHTDIGINALVRILGPSAAKGLSRSAYSMFLPSLTKR